MLTLSRSGMHVVSEPTCLSLCQQLRQAAAASAFGQSEDVRLSCNMTREHCMHADEQLFFLSMEPYLRVPFVLADGLAEGRTCVGESR